MGDRPAATRPHSVQNDYINFVRISLALAIVRLNTAKQPARVYAERLQALVKCDQKVWKHEYDSLKKELFEVKELHALRLSGQGLGGTVASCSLPSHTAQHGKEASDNLTQSGGGIQPSCLYIQHLYSLRQIVDGNLAMQTPENLALASDVFVRGVKLISDSLLSQGHSLAIDVETKRLINEVVRCLVELLNTVVSLKQNSAVETTLQSFLDQLAFAFTSNIPQESLTGLEEIVILMAEVEDCHNYLVKQLLRPVIDLSVRVSGSTAKSLLDTIDLVESLPNVVYLLEDLNRIKPFHELKERPCSATDLYHLKEAYNRLATKLPLFAILLNNLVRDLAQCDKHMLL